ncbi:putative protein of unknown function (DUF1963) [Blattamonas nauphoetae]|uniref:DUF1963 domain-containing protein n=1 Tax=Blattamonas nauphoetae TaxID=2049346 RepID=A0ABQ9YES9_9EUKA|nr:putative protein of unknown function (DUF1963) [Blattamonas nauphoetae]
MTTDVSEEKKNEFYQKLEKMLDERTKTPSLPYKLIPQKTSRYDSKMFGEPYLPPGFEYPLTVVPSVPSGGAGSQPPAADSEDKPLPLVFLGQLNFETLPHVPDFPTAGILQVYIDPRRDVYGINFDDQTLQTTWRMIYHPTIEHDETKLQQPPTTFAEGYMPGDVECLIAPESVVEERLSTYDYRFSTLWEETVQQEAIELGIEQWDCYDRLNPNEISLKHKIGGYPGFTQEDPRHQERYSEFDVLLWQSNSDDTLMWGDMGVANFFIRREDLVACRFDRVLYNWDCS